MIFWSPQASGAPKGASLPLGRIGRTAITHALGMQLLRNGKWACDGNTRSFRKIGILRLFCRTCLGGMSIRRLIRGSKSRVGRSPVIDMPTASVSAQSKTVVFRWQFCGFLQGWRENAILTGLISTSQQCWQLSLWLKIAPWKNRWPRVGDRSK